MIVDTGKKDLLKLIRENQADFKVGLFKAGPGAIVHGTVLGDLTEANYSGYALQSPAWGAESLNGTNQGLATATALIFAHNGGGTANTILGYFVKRVSTGQLWAAAYYTAARTMGAAGDSITENLTHLSDTF